MPFLSLPFHRLRYEDTGGNKPGIIFCHSFGMRSEMFDPQIAAFVQTHRCISWDQRAHGESPASNPFSFWDSAKDLLALMDHLGLARASIAGTSQGGFVALRTALLAPSRVTALAVFGTSADAEGEATKEAYKPLLTEFRSSSYLNPPRAATEMMAAVCFGNAFDATVWKGLWATWSPAQFDLAFNALVGRDGIADQLNALRKPVLVLHGTGDVAYPLEVGQRIAASIAGAEFRAIDNGQHFLSLTSPGIVNSALREFLDRHEGRPQA